jgi:hypothetical protein
VEVHLALRSHLTVSARSQDKPRILKVSGSNTEACYLNWNFSWFSLSPPKITKSVFILLILFSNHNWYTYQFLITFPHRKRMTFLSMTCYAVCFVCGLLNGPASHCPKHEEVWRLIDNDFQRSGPYICSNILTFQWRGWGKSRRTSITVMDFRAAISSGIFWTRSKCDNHPKHAHSGTVFNIYSR